MVGTLRRIVRKPIGEILLAMGSISEEQLNIALREQYAAPAGEKLGRILIRLGFTDARRIFRALEVQAQAC